MTPTCAYVVIPNDREHHLGKDLAALRQADGITAWRGLAAVADDWAGRSPAAGRAALVDCDLDMPAGRHQPHGDRQGAILDAYVRERDPYQACSGWSADGEGLHAVDRGGDVAGPGSSLGEAEPFRFPAAGGSREGEELGLGQQLAGQGRDLAPQLVLREAFQGQVPQPGVLRVPDAVLAAGPPAVPQLQVRELAAPGVSREGGEAVPVEAGEPQLGSGVRPSLRTMTRIPAGQDERSSSPVMSATQAPSRACPFPS